MLQTFPLYIIQPDKGSYHQNTKTYLVGTHCNSLWKAIPVSTYKICFVPVSTYKMFCSSENLQDMFCSSEYLQDMFCSNEYLQDMF